ncbi:hypothetical protein EJ07DRAFT_150698 [Lizonia empirigonia]|nr:hypothetical protein EJ07DRAFT_150698 [Lizonia empirigonia]
MHVGTLLTVKKAPVEAGTNPDPLLYPNEGCFVNADVTATYDLKLLNDDSMSLAVCSSACAGRQYFAIAYGRDCWCGDNPPTGTSDPAQNWRIGHGIQRVQQSGSWPPPVPPTGPGGSTSPVVIPPLQGGQYLGCFDANNVEQLPLFADPTIQPNVDDSGTTQETCQNYCAAYKFFALQNGNTCLCDNSVAFQELTDAPPTGVLLPDTSCDVRAVGDTSEAGGGANALTAFQNPNYVGECGCYDCASAQPSLAIQGRHHQQARVGQVLGLDMATIKHDINGDTQPLQRRPDSKVHSPTLHRC